MEVQTFKILLSKGHIALLENNKVRLAQPIETVVVQKSAICNAIESKTRQISSANIPLLQK